MGCSSGTCDQVGLAEPVSSCYFEELGSVAARSISAASPVRGRSEELVRRAPHADDPADRVEYRRGQEKVASGVREVAVTGRICRLPIAEP